MNMNIRLFPFWSCYEHSYTDLFVDIYFLFFLGNLEVELLGHKVDVHLL